MLWCTQVAWVALSCACATLTLLCSSSLHHNLLMYYAKAWISCWILGELALLDVIQVWLWWSVYFFHLFDKAFFVTDDNNTRVLFEKVLSSMPKDKARFVDDNLVKIANFIWACCGIELGLCKTITCCFENSVYFFQWCLGKISRVWNHKWWLGQLGKGGE